MERGQPEVILRRYTSPTYESVLLTCEADLAGMAASRYFPVAQSWGRDATSSTGFLVGGSSWKPGPDTLAVAYRRDERGATTS